MTFAETPLNLTLFEAGFDIKLAPVMVTIVPSLPLSGLSPVMIGGGGLVVNDQK